jgi:hypothetical protein
MSQKSKKLSFDVLEYAVFRIAMLVLLVTALTNLVVREVGGFFSSALQIKAFVQYFAVGFAVLATIMSAFVLAFRRPFRHSAGVKRHVADAYMQALEKSSFNPHRLRESVNEPTAR